VVEYLPPHPKVKGSSPDTAPKEVKNENYVLDESVQFPGLAWTNIMKLFTGVILQMFLLSVCPLAAFSSLAWCLHVRLEPTLEHLSGLVLMFAK
jgi:hypothetical protein